MSDIAHQTWLYVNALSADTYEQYAADENIAQHIDRLERAAAHANAGLDLLRSIQYRRARARLREVA